MTHGHSGYVNGCRCYECRLGHRTYNRELRATLQSRFAAGLIDAPHGTAKAYDFYGCRCDFCGEAGRAYRRGKYAERLEAPLRDCEDAACGRPASPGRKWCHAHANRVRKNGVCGSSESRTNGSGNGVGYEAAHDRVARRHGRASENTCAHCAGAAQEWAYIHDSPHGRVWMDSRGCAMKYSPDPDDYIPLCCKCHRAYDRPPVTTQGRG